MTSRFVVAGVAPPRTTWFDDVASWATSGRLPIEYLKCVSAAELLARFATGRACSAALIDAATSGLDRDLVDRVHAMGAAVFLVDDGRARDLAPLGADAVLPRPLESTLLLSSLHELATPIGTATTRALRPVETPLTTGTWVTVTGASGSGRSTTAIALADGLARAHPHDRTVLADLCLHADQALLHDAVDLVPALPEVVEMARTRRPTVDDVHAAVFRGEAHAYEVLLGLRRHRDWAALRPGATRTALTALAAAYSWVVADADADVEGERRTGSLDVEERNLLAREAARRASVLVLVGRADPAGIHRSVHLLEGLVDHDVDTTRVLPVLTHAPRGPAIRASLARAYAELATALTGGERLASPLFLGDRRRVDPTGHLGQRHRPGWSSALAGAVEAVLARTAPALGTSGIPERVVPGSLGAWIDAEEAAG